MADADISTLVGLFLGSFAIGYVGGLLLLVFKKAANIVF